MSTPVPESPGIYITESLTPISNTNTPGEAIGVIAGNYNQGPNLPTLITSFNQYTKVYGTFAAAAGNTALHYAVYQYFNNGGSQVYVLAVPNTDAVSSALVIQDINSPADNVMTVSAISSGAWGNSLYVSITSAGNTGRFNLNVYLGGTSASNLVEPFVDVSINPSDSRNVASLVNSPVSGSNYIKVAVTLPGAYEAGIDDPALIEATPLAGGSSGVTAPSMATAVPAALDMLQGTSLNVNVPGVYNSTTVNALITWAEERGDVMLIIDGPPPSFPETSATVTQNYVNLVTGGSPILASTYATLYAPWVQITDPASSLPGAVQWVPPGGAVLGIWSRTDNAVGPWQAPAGVQYGQIAVTNLEALFTSADLNTLNSNNINALRFVPNYYPAVMGVRTLEQGYPDRYISVRRMIIMLEHDINFLLQPALFEPNSPALWLQVDNVITNYLTNLMQDSALAGTTPDTSFTVICDSSNNTPSTAQAGIVNVDVSVALLSPAEFILITISQNQNTGSITISTSPTASS
jgi:uncharacterized protein